MTERKYQIPYSYNVSHHLLHLIIYLVYHTKYRRNQMLSLNVSYRLKAQKSDVEVDKVSRNKILIITIHQSLCCYVFQGVFTSHPGLSRRNDIKVFFHSLLLI
jgi:hypothetical protein